MAQKKDFDVSDLYSFDKAALKNDKMINLEDILLKDLDTPDIASRYQYKKINQNIIVPKYTFSTPIPQVSQYSQAPAINWGAQTRPQGPVAYIPLTPQEIQRVIEVIYRVEQLSDSERQQYIEATRELRYFFDGAIRAHFGGTRHFNAIRCLNNPQATEVAAALKMQGVQLAGEEFFGLNRFMPNFADVADIQWWAAYQNGSWGLDTWNPEGEHLDTGINGWGTLVGSVIKVNGKVLTPPEMIAFYRSVRLRNERGFVSEQIRQEINAVLTAISRGWYDLPAAYTPVAETAHDLGLVDATGKALTYTGRSMITPVTARARKERQLTETDPQVRMIIVPTIFN